MTQVSPFLTAPQVAERFGVSAETVRRWAREGKVPTVTMPSGRVKFLRADIDTLIPETAEVAS